MTGAPSGRVGHSAVWTGTEMIVFGGGTSSSLHTSSGGRYDPTTDTWKSMSTSGRGPDRIYHTAVWDPVSGAMLVWGGIGKGGRLNDGRKYYPKTDSWAPMSDLRAPEARAWHTATWMGSSIGRMLIWGGSRDGNIVLNSGEVYSVSSDSWSSMTLNNAPVARDDHTAVWDSIAGRMLIWGGFDGGGGRNDGAIYDFLTDTWTPMPGGPLGHRYSHTAIWDGTRGRLIIWGGFRSGFNGWGDGAVFQ